MALRGKPYLDLSGTIAAGGTSQQFAPADSTRTYLRISNPVSATESLFVNDKGGAASTTGAAAGSLEIPPGTWKEWVGPAPINQVNVTAATTNHAFEGAWG